MSKQSYAFKIVGILWFLWSLLHIIPGIVMISDSLSGDVSSIQFLFPDTDPQGLMADYRSEVDAILVTFGQHGFNLLWFGIVALIGSILIFFQHNRIALLFSSIVIGLADLGALFATYMIGRIDWAGILIFSGTVIGVGLTFWILRTNPKTSSI